VRLDGLQRKTHRPDGVDPQNRKTIRLGAELQKALNCGIERIGAVLLKHRQATAECRDEQMAEVWFRFG
jgi:hypothetical protein